MKYLILTFATFLLNYLFLNSQVNFDDYFIDQTLRVDYYHSGDARTEIISLDKIYRQGIWAGNPKKCIQPFDLGIYLVKVIDTTENKVIYTKGYNSIFQEYQTIGEAIQGNKKTYHETVLIPCPKRTVKIVIEKRAKNNILAPIYSMIIDPADYHILTESGKQKTDKVIVAAKNGNPHQCIDLVILGEGYTQKELATFEKDLKYYTHLLLNFEPYKSNASLFNVSGVFSVSEESGTDEPRQGVYRNTRFNSSFNTFDTDRYCLAEDNKSIRDAASIVPYDAVLIMVNKDRYGGGGIYNWQTIFTSKSKSRDYVFLHEFGHAFAGLADEYYNSSVAYEDFFAEGIEPLEPNITILLDTENVKWKNYLTPGLKIPTEWGKAVFDSLSTALNTARSLKAKTIEEMKKAGSSNESIAKAEKEMNAGINKIISQTDSFMFNHPLKGKVGVFEGANYLSKGFYRPTVNSMMHKFDPSDPSYGIVNEQAILSTIKYYTE